MAIRKNKKRIDPRYFLDEKMQIAQAAYDEIQTQFDDHRCMDTLERAEAYGDIEHNPLDNDPYGPSSNYPGKMKLKR